MNDTDKTVRSLSKFTMQTKQLEKYAKRRHFAPSNNRVMNLVQTLLNECRLKSKKVWKALQSKSSLEFCPNKLDQVQQI